MISRQLIDLLNSGEAVSIVGSGVSADAGIPTWNSLFNSVADALDREKRDTQMARVTATEGKLPEAFDLLAGQTNKSDIHKQITALIEQVSTPGTHHFQLADWPFRFHVTTNYDHLIEDASSGRLVPVGNRGSELRKVAGGGRSFVWHLHGGCRFSSDISHLVVTKSDYDDFYPRLQYGRWAQGHRYHTPMRVYRFRLQRRGPHLCPQSRRATRAFRSAELRLHRI